MIKLIVSDMDGTLIGKDMLISQKNKDAIAYATDKGIPFAIATGRHLNEAASVLDSANISCPLITANGAAVYDANRQLTDVFALSQQVSKNILTIARQFEDELAIEITTVQSVTTDNREKRQFMLQRFAKSHLPFATQEAIQEAVNNLMDTLHIEFVDSLENLIEQSDDRTILKFFMTTLTDESVLTKLKQALSSIDNVVITSSHPTNIEITSIDATKGHAVSALAAQISVPLENIMALGDNMNDLSMIESVGYGVAMDNAVQHIKDVAKYTTLSNVDDGVAHAIYHFVK
ncbi:HAD family phosphatase [Carnobacteriaceae bacterium zg-ZUI252]|nr:HAD family phosphatase [Carnobacteriaceae bacterium zg-ZUI252]